MKFFVRQLTGEQHTLDMEPNSTIADVEASLKLSGALKQQGMRNTFIFAGRQLGLHETLLQSEIKKDSVIHIISVVETPAHQPETPQQPIPSAPEPEDILLVCKSTGQTLRVRKGLDIDGKGGRGKWALFKLFGESDNTFKIFAVATQTWLCVAADDKLTATSDAASATPFAAQAMEDGTTVFRCPQGGLGIVGDGSPKAPSQTGTGDHARFTIVPPKDYASAKRERTDNEKANKKADNTEKSADKASGASGAAIETEPEEVCLTCASTTKNLRILKDLRVDGKGGRGGWATFKIYPVGSDQVLLFNVGHFAWVVIEDDQISVNSDRAKATVFSQKAMSDGTSCFRCPVGGLGIQADGTPKAPSATGCGTAGRFTVSSRSAKCVKPRLLKLKPMPAEPVPFERPLLKLKLHKAAALKLRMPPTKVSSDDSSSTSESSSSDEEISNPIGLKLYHGETIRRFDISGDRPMRSLNELVRSKYDIEPRALKMSYLDDENDWIRFSSGSELRFGLKLNGDKILKVKLELNDDMIKLDRKHYRHHHHGMDHGRRGHKDWRAQMRDSMHGDSDEDESGLFVHGNVVYLRGVGEKFLSVTADGQLCTQAKPDHQSKWKIVNKGPGIILRSVAVEKNIRINKKGEVELFPGFGRFVRFTPEPHPSGNYTFLNLGNASENWHLGLTEDKVFGKAGRGPFAQFSVLPANA